MLGSLIASLITPRQCGKPNNREHIPYCHRQGSALIHTVLEEQLFFGNMNIFCVSWSLETFQLQGIPDKMSVNTCFPLRSINVCVLTKRRQWQSAERIRDPVSCSLSDNISIRLKLKRSGYAVFSFGKKLVLFSNKNFKWIWLCCKSKIRVQIYT